MIKIKKIIFLYLIIIIIFKINFNNIETQGLKIKSIYYNEILIVDHNGNGNFINIQSAIDNISKGGIIYVWSGNYYENILINKSLTLVGNGTLNTIICNNEKKDIVLIKANSVNITGFTITVNISSPEGSGIKLEKVRNCNIWKNNCSGNSNGIYLEHSHNNSLKYNQLNDNKYAGIDLYYSNSNLIFSNNCSNNRHGITFLHSNNNTIKNNSVNMNYLYNGIYLGYSKSNNISGNECSYNKRCGLTISDSYHNLIYNNNFSKNIENGIFIEGSDYNYIFKNKCLFNELNGIKKMNSNSNVIVKNINNQNNLCGIYVQTSKYNELIYNNCSFNKYDGIVISDFSNKNIIHHNNLLKNNWNGIYLYFYSKSNLFFENNISNNSKIGIHIESDCKKNTFFKNNFISNAKQVIDNGTNYWYRNNIGNYWSDYQGLDNGANGRNSNDGIGDTELPHQGLDIFPLMKPKEWICIPTMSCLKLINDNLLYGNYTISWFDCFLADGYILEEDNNNKFSTPVMIYNGTNLQFKFKFKINGTYFYRLKSYNKYGESFWSKIICIDVDWIPNTPQNLTVNVYPKGNALIISWLINSVDTNEYLLCFKNSTITNWTHFEPIFHPINYFNHTNLSNGEKYYYRIYAKDFENQSSGFSNIASGIPCDSVPPAPPTGLRVVTATNDSISLTWNPNNEDDLEGYHLFRSKHTNPSSWNEPIGTIPKGNEEFFDMGLDENTTYYYVLIAFDEVPNNSSYSKTAVGTTTLGEHRPEINISQDDFTIPEDKIDDSTIKLYKWFKDINNDHLEFKCEGNKNISVTIFQNNGTVVLIPAKDWNGQETLTFYANNSNYEISDDVIITVTPVNDPPGPAIIIKPNDGREVENGTIINFSAICFDPDLIYEDKLTFIWSSNISGTFGSGENLTDIILQSGHHQIILEVRDVVGETVIDIINITILPELIPDNNIIPIFNFELKLIPDTIELKPGDNFTLQAIVTNLGNQPAEISLIHNIQTKVEIEVSIIGDNKKIIEPNKTADFTINIKVLESATKGEVIVTFTAISGTAINYELEIKRTVTLSIKVLEEKDTLDKDQSSNLWWIIILIVIIIIVIILFIIFISKKKKESPKEKHK